jgi:hypothetical protein
MTDHEADEVCEWMREMYGRRPEWPGRLLRQEWGRVLSEVSFAEGMALVRKLAQDRAEFPPTPMAFSAAVPAATAGPNGPRACPDCYKTPGWREMSIRYRLPDGTEHVQERVAACECAAGRAHSAAKLDSGARVLTWRELWAEWQQGRDRLIADGGEVISIHRTHRDMISLPVRPRSIVPVSADGGAYARAALEGRDQYAAARARSVSQEALREEMDGSW